MLPHREKLPEPNVYSSVCVAACVRSNRSWGGIAYGWFAGSLPIHRRRRRGPSHKLLRLGVIFIEQPKMLCFQRACAVPFGHQHLGLTLLLCRLVCCLRVAESYHFCPYHSGYSHRTFVSFAHAHTPNPWRPKRFLKEVAANLSFRWQFTNLFGSSKRRDPGR